MKNQILLFVILFTLTIGVLSPFSIPVVKGQPYYDSWFTRIRVTHVKGTINLIDGGMAKVYDGQTAVKELSFYNNGCGSFGADLYTRIYRDGELVDTSMETYVGIGSSDTDEFSTALSGPATYSYRVELWWENWGEHLLVDVKKFDVKVVKLAVYNWVPSSLSIERGFESGDLTVTFTNGGNDRMHDTSVSVVDSAGLTVTPFTQHLGNINEGGTKTTTFSVQADKGKTVQDYNLTFEVAYNDMREVTHTETFHANVSVTSNIIKENLTYIAILIIVIVVSIAASVLYYRRRKPETIMKQ